MIYRIRPSSIHGSLALPSSKSQTLRALFFACLAKGESEIKRPLISSDTKAFLSSMPKLGVKVDREQETIRIQGCGGVPRTKGGHIDVGNSGLGLRFLTAGCALGSHYMMLTGDTSLRSLRPMDPLISALCQMGGFCISTKNDGKAPIIVKGPIFPSKVVMDGADSQPLSALLIAASFLEGKTEIRVKNPGERPWVDLTLHWLEKFLVPIQRKEHHYYAIEGSVEKKAFYYEVPGDMSAMAFPLALALLSPSSLLLQNVAFADQQGDKKLIDILKTIGGKIVKEEKKGELFAKESPLSSFCVDVNEIIDALPILAVVACFAKGKSYLKNGAIARKKESDRLSAITKELRKMGAKIEEKKEGLIIEQASLRGALVESHGDHRIAMALAVAAMSADEGETVLKGAECVEKSYPHFFEEMKRLGADISAI
jgi:3-phosphoshikimate 1-carboxyvinyltransferase